MVIFFILTAIASIGATLSMLEVPVAILSERYGMARKRSALVTILAVAVLGIPAALSQSLAADVKVFGLSPFDLFDFLTSNVFLPVGGILISLFVGWVFGLPQLERRLSNEGQLANRRLVRAVFFLVRYVAPISIVIVLLNGLKLI
jgi:NSS family neurotransmitter:Na+ symporter